MLWPCGNGIDFDEKCRRSQTRTSSERWTCDGSWSYYCFSRHRCCAFVGGLPAALCLEFCNHIGRRVLYAELVQVITVPDRRENGGRSAAIWTNANDLHRV